MNEINLPPLPEPAVKESKGVCCGNFTHGGEYMGQREPLCCGQPDEAHPDYFTAEQFHAGQIAAVEKDRAERGGVPDAIRTEAANLASILGGMVEGGYSDIDTLYTEDQADGDAFVKRASEVLGLLSAAPQPQPVHDDDLAVDKFAAAMKAKLAAAREKGLEGWEECSQTELSRMLREHVEKGDPRDVANFCMFLWSLGFGIAPQPVQEAPQKTVGWGALTWDVTDDGGAQPVQREPLTPDELADKCESWLNNPGATNSVDAFEAGFRSAETHHGITKKG